MIKYILIFGAIVLSPSCRRQKQVWLGELQRGNSVVPEHVTRVYFDKFGDIYSPDGPVIPYKAFFDPNNSGNTYKETLETGNLQYYYCKHPNELKSLAQIYGVSDSNACEVTFQLIQKGINEKIKNAINEDLDNDRTLVVFIHGFNDPNPTGDFRELRNNIQARYSTQKFSYLEVFWDGLTCNQGNPALSKIWGRAQTNSSMVAIGLRMLLEKVKNVPIRIVTHSLGASVATGAIFNTNSKWRNNSIYTDLSSSTVAPSQEDIRLGMLAPAIPGVSTFCDFNDRGPTVATPDKININRIVIGFNRNDLAITKRVHNRDHAGNAGATNLGCDYRHEINKTIQALMSIGYSQQQAQALVSETDFTIGEGKIPEEHGLYYYMQNKVCMDDFLDKLFN